MLRKLFRRDDGTFNPLGIVIIAAISIFVIPMIFAVGFAALMVHNITENEPKSAAIQSKLEDEYRSIQQLPQANEFDYHASHKSRHALVTSYFKTNLAYSEIRAYYDGELSKHGWIFYDEEQMKDWGRDLGGKSAHYCKGEYRADLEYAGDQADNGWDYALSVSWGLDPLADDYSDKFRKFGCQ